MSIRIVRFWTEYPLNSDGTRREVDMVEYGPIGQIHMRTTRDSLSRLSKVRPVAENSEDEAAKMAQVRWAIIEPAYRAWKTGQDTPENGTAFGKWPGVLPEQVEVLKSVGLRSVEELANASDGVIAGIKLPRIRELREQAKSFLLAFDKQAAAMRLTQMETENAVLKDMLEEMRASISELQADKPKRGRPPKAQEEEAAA